MELSTFSFNGRPHDFGTLIRLPVLVQRLKAAVHACADSDIILRKVLLLTSEVTDTVYLWCGQVMSSFEELTTAICAKLEAKVCLAMSRGMPNASTHSHSNDCMTYALWRLLLHEVCGCGDAQAMLCHIHTTHSSMILSSYVF